MNVPVRMPRIAASDVSTRVESVSIRVGSAVREGDSLLELRVGNLPVTLHAELIGVVKDVRAEAGAEILADRIICWIESPDLPPIKAVTVAAPARDEVNTASLTQILFRLPPELLGTYTPLVRKVHAKANETVRPDVALMEVAIGPCRFEWRSEVAGVISGIAVGEGDPLHDGTLVATLAGDTPAERAIPPVVSSKPKDVEIPEMTLLEFRGAAHRLREKVLALADLVSALGLANTTDFLCAEAGRLADPRFSIAVVGEFKRGKSSFLNALAGGEFLPNDVIPCTAFACRFRYGETLQLALVDDDGQETVSPLRTQAEISAELDRLTHDPATPIREAIVRLPLPLLHDGVDLIDTPGLNDSEAMNRLTLSVLPNVDAAVLLLIPESPLSDTERRFLQDHLLGRDVARIVFVLNAKDRVAPDKLPRLVQYLRSRLGAILAERDVGEGPLLTVSAKEELQNPGGITTGFVELRQHLASLLFSQRGRLILAQTLQRTGRAAVEALGAINLRLAQAAISAESFHASLKEVSRQLAATRLHANEMRRRLGDVRTQANSIAATQARNLYLALLSLRDSLPQLLSPDLLKSGNPDDVKTQLSSLLQQESGKLYQQAITPLIEEVRTIYAPMVNAIRNFSDEAEKAFSSVAFGVYQSAIGGPPPSAHVPMELAPADQMNLSGGFGIHVDLSLGAMSWLLLMESAGDVLAKAGLAGSIEARAIIKLREDFGNEIERQVRTRANESVLTARFLEIARRPFDRLLESFNQELKVLVDDTTATLAALQATALGERAERIRYWTNLRRQIQNLLAECEQAAGVDRAGAAP